MAVSEANPTTTPREVPMHYAAQRAGYPGKSNQRGQFAHPDTDVSPVTTAKRIELVHSHTMVASRWACMRVSE